MALSDQDEEIEGIGNALWVGFGAGASPVPFDFEVIGAGRDRYRAKIKDWLDKHGTGTFPAQDTVQCAYQAGVKAADLAKSSSVPIIGVSHFNDACDYLTGSIQTALGKALAARLPRPKGRGPNTPHFQIASISPAGGLCVS